MLRTNLWALIVRSDEDVSCASSSHAPRASREAIAARTLSISSAADGAGGAR